MNFMILSDTLFCRVLGSPALDPSVVSGRRVLFAEVAFWAVQIGRPADT